MHDRDTRQAGELAASGPFAPGVDGAPLYRTISLSLRGAIESGAYPVGSMLPTEAELAEQFDVSRHTIREAIRGLAELGMVERRQGFGTRVTAPAPPSNYIQSMRSLEELTQYARDTQFDIERVETVAVTAEEAELIAARPESRWLRITGLRWDGSHGSALCSTTVFVHLRFAGLLHDVRQAQGPIYGLVERRSGENIDEAIQEISAGPMPRPVAAALGLRTGAPAMRFVRRYLDASGAPMVVSVNWHPADRFVYRMRLKRGDGARTE